MKKFSLAISINALAITSLFLFSTNSVAQGQPAKVTQSFTEVIKAFPVEEKNRRKWDAPVVADLDQDGYPDLLLNDHGYGVSVAWNNQGKFAKPYDIIMGDMHGVSAGDFDQDGKIEIIISRGGGSGSNARNSRIFKVQKDRAISPIANFKEPLALMRGRTVKFVDGDNDGYLDLLNFAFPDKNKKGESENYIYKNDKNGQLILHSHLPAIKRNGQKVLLSDFNDDGTQDIILYGHGTVKAYQGNGDLTYEEVSNSILPGEIEDVFGIIELDYDNDGDMDLYLARGQEFKKRETFYDQDSKTWGFFTTRGAFQFEDLQTGDVLEIENYQAQWPVNDEVFLAETGYNYVFEGETHSGKDMKLVSSDILGFPDSLSKKGLYVGFVGNESWRLAGNIWSPTTGIVYGVAAYPAMNHHPGFNDILLENKNGKFVDVTASAKLQFKAHSMGVTTADLDNNGFQDIVITSRGDLVHPVTYQVYMNMRERGFEKLENHGITSTELGAIGMAITTVDYDLDGKVDVVAGNERGRWHLYKNEFATANENNFLTIYAGNSPKSKASPLGARIELKGCERQVRVVGATGAAYSLDHNPLVHFGVGTCTKAQKLKVRWSNGEVLEKSIKTTNQQIKVGI
ncbi:CRTAC1 family protein [Reichenbachiella sp.]|uniref:CRTAC1 family protein n=1 Tax=Reichenbachiella sp. TaxID=2184521 RepID=UPI003BB05867